MSTPSSPSLAFGRGMTFAMSNVQDIGKGVEFKGGSLHDGFGGFDGFGSTAALLLLQSTLPSFRLSYKNTGAKSQP